MERKEEERGKEGKMEEKRREKEKQADRKKNNKREMTRIWNAARSMKASVIISLSPSPLKL